MRPKVRVVLIDGGEVIRIKPGGDVDGSYVHSGDLFNYMRWLKEERPEMDVCLSRLEEALALGLVRMP